MESNDPLAVPRQIPLHDPRSVNYRARIYPHFRRTPHGEIVGDATHLTVFYGSGDCGSSPGWPPSAWDLRGVDMEFPGGAGAVKGSPG